ncbi:hypothetical protein VTI74DRAFT_7271 [Chaetomium olivicolor]
MTTRNLLLCFDAFGTLFTPKQPIAEQYAIVARQCGLDGFSVDQVKASFKAAFSEEFKAHPNYGRASGMGAARWWTNVINNTFQPLVKPPCKLPVDLAPRLLHRFSSNEGYTLSPGVDALLRSLKKQQHHRSSRIIVGVITNSDDRVPSILTSLGLRVSPFRFGSPVNFDQVVGQEYDVDMHCISYDVGFAKPDRRIFDAAKGMAEQLAAARNAGEPLAQGAEQVAGKEEERWIKLYIGDEYEKDVIGACAAGWHSVFIGTESDIPPGENGMLDLEQCRTAAPEEVFGEGQPPTAIRAGSTQDLIRWLSKRCAGGSSS